MRFRAVALAMLTLAAGAAAVLVACQGDFIGATPCGEIPAGGCPSVGDACIDTTCSALYTCSSDGIWTRVQTCPAREPDADAAAPDAASDGSVSQRDASQRDASWVNDVPGASGGPGCGALEPPDCSLGLAASCPENQCCGCEDLFVCRAGGWDVWGSCADGGVLSTLSSSPSSP